MNRTRALLRHVGPRDLIELVIIVVAYLVYFGVRGQVIQRPHEAIGRAIHLIEIEERLHLFWEADLQHWLLGYRWLVDLMNWTYFYAHWPVIVVVGLCLYIWRRQVYVTTRNAFLLSGAIGLVIFMFFPVAPPRLLPAWGFVDTMAIYFGASYETQAGAFVNSFAAMPSLHFGWNLLVGLAIIRATGNILARTFAVIMPIMMLLAVVLTGNHFILDAVAGVVVALIGLALALQLRRIQWFTMSRSMEPA